MSVFVVFLYRILFGSWENYSQLCDCYWNSFAPKRTVMFRGRFMPFSLRSSAQSLLAVATFRCTNKTKRGL